MYRAAVRWFHERIGEKAVDQITKQDVVAFKAKLVAEGCSRMNIKNKLSRLRRSGRDYRCSIDSIE